MPRCEDYPCCGHEPNDCPDRHGRFRCVDCGRMLRKGAASSLCSTCLARMSRSYWDPDRELESY